MKKILLTIACACVVLNVSAQKYMTRTGKVTFFSSTKVENIEAVNNDVASVVDLGTGSVMIQVPVKSFRFDKQLMQDHFNENYMESDQFPKSEFKGRIPEIAGLDLSKNSSYKVNAAGKLTMHGVTRDVTIPGTVVVKSNTVSLNSVFHVKPADYGIKIPGLVAEKIAQSIEITVNSVLNPAK